MSIRRINHVVLSVTNLDASTSFYRDILGLELVATLPAQESWKEMRFFRAPGESTNHHDIGIIAGATLPLPGWGQPSAPGLFHVAFEVGTIEELEHIGLRLKAANALMDYVEQPMHLSVYGRDPDGLALEVVWRVPSVDWSYVVASPARLRYGKSWFGSRRTRLTEHMRKRNTFSGNRFGPVTMKPDLNVLYDHKQRCSRFDFRMAALDRPRSSARPVTIVGVENNNWEDQGQRNAKTLMQILGGNAIPP